MPEGPHQSWDDEIDLRKDPYRIKVGDRIFEFVPELESDLFLEAYRKIAAVREEIAKARAAAGDALDVDQVEKMTRASREYLAMLMLPDSGREFMGKPVPDRVVMLMTQKIMEHYSGGTRPTGSASGSSAGSSQAGRPSTGRSRSKA